MLDPIWVCKYNRAIDCGAAIPNCDACGWNPFNVALKCVRILKVLGVSRYANTSPNSNPNVLDCNIQGGRETR